MPRLIDAENLEKRIKENYCSGCNSFNGVVCRSCGCDDCLDMIDSEETADAEPVRHGHWIPNTNGGHDCSRCHADLWYDGVPIKMDRLPYCPHCGAKMDGGDSRED